MPEVQYKAINIKTYFNSDILEVNTIVRLFQLCTMWDGTSENGYRTQDKRLSISNWMSANESSECMVWGLITVVPEVSIGAWMKKELMIDLEIVKTIV